jgi:hypothetical protein
MELAGRDAHLVPINDPFTVRENMADAFQEDMFIALEASLVKGFIEGMQKWLKAATPNLMLEMQRS